MLARKNLGLPDRIVRLVIGVVSVYFGFVNTDLVGNALIATFVGVFGLINIYATLSSHCPVYSACGINTYKDKPAAK